MTRIIYVVPNNDGVSPSFATEAEAEAYIEQKEPCKDRHEHFRFDSLVTERWPSSVADTVYVIHSQPDGKWRIGHHFPTDAMGCEWASARGGYIVEVTIDD